MASASGFTAAEREEMTTLATVVEAQRAALVEQRPAIAALQAALTAQQAVNADQQARLSRLEGLLPPGRR